MEEIIQNLPGNFLTDDHPFIQHQANQLDYVQNNEQDFVQRALEEQQIAGAKQDPQQREKFEEGQENVTENQPTATSQVSSTVPPKINTSPETTWLSSYNRYKNLEKLVPLL